MEKKTKIIKDLQQEVSLRPGLGSRTFFGVFLIQWYSCVCSCNFTRLEGELVSIRGGRTHRNWSTSPEYVGVPFDRRCDCDCHGSCGWQIGSLSASSTPPPPTPLAQHSNNHVTWCTATFLPGPVSVRTPNFDIYWKGILVNTAPPLWGARILWRLLVSVDAVKNEENYLQTCAVTTTMPESKSNLRNEERWCRVFGPACGLLNYMTRSRRMLLHGDKKDAHCCREKADIHQMFPLISD